MNSKIRVRFAPSPTGFMHLGNVRVALLNYLFAKKNNGAFILRVEDTDFERNIDPQASVIVANLNWLGLFFDEGPQKEGAFGPYFQSQRTALYQEKLHELQKKELIYRCFCTVEELEKKRQRQLALKQPPRYDRTCLKLSHEVIEKNLASAAPFIWRLKTTQEKEIAIRDLAHGTINFNLKDFSDFPLTRADGSFTFIFANCVDDILMEISHIIRGEDHITNTANQVVLYNSFNAPVPIFWHVPIMCNAEGKKLSKRDFGFSLNDLQKAGFLPEAICNYLGIIGGSFEQEILSLEQLAAAYDFENIHATGHIKYDLEKLRWMNHKWISTYDTKSLTDHCLPFLSEFYPQAKELDLGTLETLVNAIKTDLITLHDAAALLKFYFEAPTVTVADLQSLSTPELCTSILEVLEKNLPLLDNSSAFIEAVKKEAKEKKINLRDLLGTLRFILTGNREGLGIKELFDVLGSSEAAKRLQKIVS